MLTNTNKGPGLLQSLARDLQGVTLKIRNPVVCVASGDPRLLVVATTSYDPPPVVIEVKDGAVIACDDEATAKVLDGATLKVCGGEIVESSNDAFVQELIDAYTIEHAKKWKAEQIALHGKALQDSFVSLYSVGEMSSWAIKRAESAAFAASALPADAPILAHEATIRGITLAALCAKVDANAQAFAMLQATISGVEGAHRDAVSELESFDSINGYDYLGGWPAVEN